MSQQNSGSKQSLQNILYDLLVVCEWPPEQDGSSRQAAAASLFTLVESLKARAKQRLWTVLRSSGLIQRLATPCLLPDRLVKLINLQQHWKIALSRDGEYLAVIQDISVEIRRQRDNFGTLVGRYLLDKDPNPQWRHVAWSYDSSILAVSSSTAELHAMDILGNRLFLVQAGNPTTQGNASDLSAAIASIIFVPSKRNSGPDNGLNMLVTNFHGCLSCYKISPNQEPMLDHQFSFGDMYPSGISAVLYSMQHDMLIVGGSTGPTLPTWSEAGQQGITAWRLLSASPYYKLATTLDEDRQKVLESRGKRVLKRVKTVMSGIMPSTVPLDGAYKLCLSPEGTGLLVLDYVGNISFWDMPSLRKRQKWDRQVQPAYGLVNPSHSRKSRWPKVMKEKEDWCNVMCAEWWSEEAVILACVSGAVTVTDVRATKNLLGEFPEWFEPCPQVSGIVPRGGAFLILECEFKKPRAGSHKIAELQTNDSTSSDLSDNEQDETVTSLTLLQRASNMAKQLLKSYLANEEDISRWPRKIARHRLRRKNYRLVVLRKTTPEELYERKISDEEYGEALALAKVYGLDADRVYQKQFRMSTVTLAAIQDYLCKICKRSWVVHECLDRVPRDIDAARELLNTGLRYTSLAAILRVGAESGHISPELAGLLDESESAHANADPEEEEQIRSLFEIKLLKHVNFQEMTLEQKELCRARLRLLQYSDRLSVYEEIMGGPHAAERHFDPAVFHKFRSQDIVEAVVSYAQAGDWKAVATIFTYLGGETLPHRLAILSNFPETQPPAEYADLLPSVMRRHDHSAEEQRQHVGCSLRASSSAEQLEMSPWPELSIRQPAAAVDDWCEQPACLAVIRPQSLSEGCDISLYEDEPSLRRFRASLSEPVTAAMLTEWYTWRASSIDKLSCQVENAASLVKLGIDKDVPGLSDLYHDLNTMEMLVYECGVGYGLRLDQLRLMSDAEKVYLLMSKSTTDMFVKNLHRWLVPFLQRCESRCQGSYDELLASYVTRIAEENMQLAVKVFEASKISVGSASGSDMGSQGVIRNEEQLVSLAITCAYATDRFDDNVYVAKIADCLPPISASSRKSVPKLDELHNDVEKLRIILRAADILTANGVQTPLVHIRNSQLLVDDAKMLMVKLTRRAGCREPALKEAQWRKLLDDMLTIRSLVYPTLLDEESCVEIFLESLLCSGKLENIHLAGSYFVRAAMPGPLAAKSITSPNSVPGQKLTMPSSSSTVPPLLPPRPLSSERVAALVLKAAREYFNAASSSSDACLALAKVTLQAAGACTSTASMAEPFFAAIKEELDLIAAVGIMEEMGLQQLPLQVRLCQDRITIIENILAVRKDNYKQHLKLMHLGELLRIIADKADDAMPSIGECCILRSLARRALAADDYEVAHAHCRRLMAAGYGDAWAECSELAAGEQSLAEHDSYESRLALLSFVAAHCTADVLENILKDLCVTQLQALQKQLVDDFHHGHSDADAGSVPTPEISQLAQTTRHQHKLPSSTKELMALTGQTTKSLFKAILGSRSSGRLFESTLSVLAGPLPLLGGSEAKSVKTGPNHQPNNLQYQCCHEFYDGFMNGCIAVPSDAPDATYCLLRTSVLQQMLVMYDCQGSLTGDDSHAAGITEILLQCSSSTAPHDLTLSLSYLLALPQADAAEQFFTQLTHTPLALNLMAYYYALQLASAIRAKADDCVQLYVLPPDDAVSLLCENADAAKSQNQNIKVLFASLRRSVKLLEDNRQAQLLHDLGRGVDSERFTRDDEYKKDTILGLAMSAEESHYRIATSLAHKYSVPAWDVDMAHLEFLFCDSGIETSEIETRISQLQLLSSLQGCDSRAGSEERVARFCSRLEDSVFPSIDGTDHKRLVLYYQLLPATRLCNDCSGLTAGDHVKVIRKLSAAAPALDYVQLVEGREPVLGVIEKVLTAENVHVFAKLAAKMPKLPDGTKCIAGAIYRTWIQKSFWEGHPNAKKAPQTGADWVHRFEQASGGSSREAPLQRLSPADMVTLVDALLLSDKALEKLPQDASREICSRLLRACQRQSTAHAAGPGSSAAAAAGAKQAEAVTWTDAAEHLRLLLGHIDVMHTSETLTALRAAATSDTESTTAMKTYYNNIYRSASDSATIRSVLVQMLIDGQPLELVNDLLVALPSLAGTRGSESACTVRALVSEALETICIELRDSPGTGFHLEADKKLPAGSRCQSLNALDRLITSVIEHVTDGGGDLVQADDVLTVLRSVITDEAIPQPSRLHALALFEKCFSLSEADQSLLALCQTQAAISEELWPVENSKITGDDVKDPAAREKLFSRLLETASTARHMKALNSLLMSWPPPLAEKIPLYMSLFQAWLLPANLGSGGAKEIVSACKQLTSLARSTKVKAKDAAACTSIERLLKSACDLLEGQALPVDALRLALSCCADGDVHMKNAASQLLQRLNAAEVAQASADEDILLLLSQSCGPGSRSPSLVSAVCPELLAALFDYVIVHWMVPAGADTQRPLGNSLVLALRASGLEAQAASLAARGRGLHSGLRSFGAVLGVLDKWFNSD